MQTVHMGATAPSPASPGSWQMVQALVGRIGSAGEPHFDQAAIARLNPALPLCWWSVYSVHPLHASSHMASDLVISAGTVKTYQDRAF